MYFKDAEQAPSVEVTGGFKTMLVITAAIVILLGVKPGLLLNLMSI
jgi:NADH-quinone oxidoreductase subunit N